MTEPVDIKQLEADLEATHGRVAFGQLPVGFFAFRAPTLKEWADGMQEIQDGEPSAGRRNILNACVVYPSTYAEGAGELLEDFYERFPIAIGQVFRAVEGLVSCEVETELLGEPGNGVVAVGLPSGTARFRGPSLDQWDECQREQRTGSRFKSMLSLLATTAETPQDRVAIGAFLERYPAEAFTVFDRVTDLATCEVSFTVKKG